MFDCGAHIPLLDQLSDDVRDRLLSTARVRSFDRGTTITLQGEQTKCLKVVLVGWVKLYRVSENGAEAILATLQEGQSFDEVASLKGRQSPTSAEAVSDCEVLYIDLSKTCPDTGARQEITAAVLDAASGHLDCFMDDIETLKVKTGAERLTEYLLNITATETGQIDFDLPFEKTVLAGKLGMKPESLSRAFSRLKKYGVKSDKGRVAIGDVALLRSASTRSAEYV